MVFRLNILLVYIILIKNINNMKLKLNTITIALFTFCIISCSSSDDSNSGNNNVFGTIELSGADTASVGTTLVVGNIEANAFNTTGTSSSVVLLDENTTIENDELVSTDFANAFIIVAAQFSSEDNAAADKTISMTILKNGEEFRYVCSTPPTSTIDNTDCGLGYSVDKIAKRVTFNDTTVINVDSGSILTMNGIINYN